MGLLSAMKVGNPLFVILSATECWHCGDIQPVVALGSPRVSEASDELDTFGSGADGELVLLYEVEHMPPEVENFINSMSSLHLHYVRTGEHNYFTNHCACGAGFWDPNLFHEDGPFAPLDQAAAAKLSVIEVPLAGPFDFVAGWLVGSGDLIATFARKIEIDF
jgi:hypothetical protein